MSRHLSETEFLFKMRFATKTRREIDDDDRSLKSKEEKLVQGERSLHIQRRFNRHIHKHIERQTGFAGYCSIRVNIVQRRMFNANTLSFRVSYFLSNDD